MQIPTLIEPIAGRGFRAQCGGPVAILVEAATREDAIRQLQAQVKDRIANGAELLSLEMSAADHPWEPFAGDLRNDPLLNDWSAAMVEYRTEVDRTSPSP